MLWAWWSRVVPVGSRSRRGCAADKSVLATALQAVGGGLAAGRKRSRPLRASAQAVRAAVDRDVDVMRRPPSPAAADVRGRPVQAGQAPRRWRARRMAASNARRARAQADQADQAQKPEGPQRPSSVGGRGQIGTSSSSRRIRAPRPGPAEPRAGPARGSSRGLAGAIGASESSRRRGRPESPRLRRRPRPSSS